MSVGILFWQSGRCISARDAYVDEVFEGSVGQLTTEITAEPVEENKSH